MPLTKDEIDNELEENELPVEGQKDEKPVVEKPPVTDANAELRTAMADLAKTVGSIAKKDDKPEELSQDQKDELWAVYNPEKSRADFMRKFFRLNEDATPEQIKEAKDLFGEMQTGLVKQAVVGARHFNNAELDKFRSELKPVLEFVSRAQAKEIRSRFEDTYPALADKRFDKILKASAKAMDENDFKSEDDYFKALAESAAETIKGVLPDFDLGAEKQKEKKPAGTTPRLSRGSAGGTGGAGGSGRQNEEPVSTTGNQIDDLE